jgi:hypothetical protein
MPLQTRHKSGFRRRRDIHRNCLSDFLLRRTLSSAGYEWILLQVAWRNRWTLYSCRLLRPLWSFCLNVRRIEAASGKRTHINSNSCSGDVRAIVRDELAPIRSELESIRRDLDDLREKVESVIGFQKKSTTRLSASPPSRSTSASTKKSPPDQHHPLSPTTASASPHPLEDGGHARLLPISNSPKYSPIENLQPSIDCGAENCSQRRRSIS